MAYPSTIDNFTPRTDDPGGDEVVANDINELQTAIEAIETELGTLPKGDAADVTARLAVSLNDAGYVRFAASSALTISSGAITVAKNVHTIDTEAAAASDDLDTINGGAANWFLILRTTSASRDVVVKHDTGNIYCAGGADFTLGDLTQFAFGYYDGGASKWMLFHATTPGAGTITASGTAADEVAFMSSATEITSDDDFTFSTAAGLVINETGGTAVDFRVETDTVTHALFVDASANAVYVGGTGAGDWIKANGTAGVVINEASGSAIDFRVETDNHSHAIFVDSSFDAVYFGGTGSGDWLNMGAAWGVYINEALGANIDFKVATQSWTSAFLIDASADAIYFGASGTWLKVDPTVGVIVNEGSGSGIDFRVESNTADKAIFVDSSEDTVQFGDVTGGTYVTVAKTGAMTISTATAAALTIGNGAAGVDYAITVNAETNDLTLTWMEDEAYLKSTAALRGATSLFRRYYHLPLAAINPGASGATWTAPTTNTLGGWQVDSATEVLYLQTDVHSDWDGASDLTVEVKFEVNVNNTGGGVGDTVDLKLVCYYKGNAETACKTQTVEVPVTVGQSAQYKRFTATFTINYDETDNVVEVGDVMRMILNLETDTSEVDNIIINSAEYYYQTTHMSIESGDV